MRSVEEIRNSIKDLIKKAESAETESAESVPAPTEDEIDASLK